MCLAIPARVVRIDGTAATVEMAGVTIEASLILLPETHIGDYVLLHAGYAIQRLDEGEARQTLRLFDEMADSAAEE